MGQTARLLSSDPRRRRRMNRLISTNLDGVTPDRLPPPRREGPARILFIHGNILGFKTVARQLKRYAEARDDVDAVHIDLVAPMWLKVIGKSFPVPTRGWDFHSYRYLRIWGLIMARWVRSGRLPLDRFDAMHVMTQGNAWFIHSVPRAERPRLAINVDGTARQDVTDFGFSPTARAPYIAAERSLFRQADLMVTRNHWAPRSLAEDYDVPADRIHVAQNSLELPGAHRWDGVERERSALPRIVFAGSWVRKDGPLALRVHQDRLRDKAELHILSKRTPPKTLPKNVFFHGYVPREQLINDFLPSMDVFLLPSREDMLPWALLEAAGAGLPIVASRVGSIPEIVEDGLNGFLCPPRSDRAFADALERLVDDPGARERMGRAGRERVAQNHNPDVTYPALIDRLVRLAGEGQRP